MTPAHLALVPHEHQAEVVVFVPFSLIFPGAKSLEYWSRGSSGLRQCQVISALEIWKAATWGSLHISTQHSCLNIVLHKNSKFILAPLQGLFSAWMPRSLFLSFVFGWCPGIKDTQRLKRQHCLQWKYFPLTGAPWDLWRLQWGQSLPLEAPPYYYASLLGKNKRCYRSYVLSFIISVCSL